MNRTATTYPEPLVGYVTHLERTERPKTAASRKVVTLTANTGRYLLLAAFVVTTLFVGGIL